MLKQLVLILAFTACATPRPQDDEDPPQDDESGGGDGGDGGGDCVNYADHMKPLIESGDVAALREAFKKMNADRNVVTPYALYAMESSVIVDTNYMKMLVSLSRPMLDKMDTNDVWPENYNLPTPFIGKVCEKDLKGELQCSDGASSFHAKLNPLNTYHGGVRYVYNCKTLQTKSCLKKQCKYNPEVAIIKAEKGREVFVPIENFIASDGSAMSEHITEGDDSFMIDGFSKLVVRECYSRQLFFVPAADKCFKSAMFFSLSEAVAMGGMHQNKNEHGSGYDFMKPRTAYFVVMEM